MFFIFAMFLVATCTLSVVVRDYNRPYFFEFKSFAELQESSFFSNGLANTNVLLAVVAPECSEDLSTNPQFRGIQQYAGGNVVVALRVGASEYPHRLREGFCSELIWFPIGDELHSKRVERFRFSGVNLDTFEEWLFSVALSVDVTMRNEFDFPVELFFVDETYSNFSQGVFLPREEFIVDTFLGHIFTVARFIDNENMASSDGLVDFFVVDGAPVSFSPFRRLQTCDTPNTRSPLVAAEIPCEDMSGRFEVFTQQVWMDKRIGLNYVQPQEVPAVTSEGFHLRKLPPSTYAWLKSWYEQRRDRGARTETSVGPCMNQIDAPSEIVQLTKNVMDRLSSELQGILEAWYGEGALQLTSIYGIRKYTNNSILRMHVDTRHTHVVSAIINVDQDVDEPWDLFILDHTDREHRLSLQPGDMLLYESAKLLHGRPVPMRGRRYENVFIHFKPEHGWD